MSDEPKKQNFKSEEEMYAYIEEQEDIGRHP
jgi:hypothetical protein